MFGKKFGLEKAKTLRSKYGTADLPTLKAILAVLDVPNTVKSEVTVKVNKAKGEIGIAKSEISSVKVSDGNDEVETQRVIQTAKTARADRTKANATEIKTLEQLILKVEAEIAGLEDLAARYG